MEDSRQAFMFFQSTAPSPRNGGIFPRKATTFSVTIEVEEDADVTEGNSREF
jgi:hypothetical protein